MKTLREYMDKLEEIEEKQQDEELDEQFISKALRTDDTPAAKRARAKVMALTKK